MALKLENINNLIADDLASRNENWTEIDTKLSEKANKQQEAWITPTLLNGWEVRTFAVGYRKDEFGRVHLKGRIGSGIAGTVAFVLPVGYRPPAYVGMLGMSNETTMPRLTISSNGEVTVTNYTAFIYIDNVSFSTN